jgi:CysZ protein
LLKEIVIAIQSYFQAHRFIRRHRLWKWILIPGIIYTLLFIVSMYFFGKSANNFIEWILNITHANTWLHQFNNRLLSFLFVFTAAILWLVLMMFYFSLFKYLWLIIGSPVFAYLSEKTEAIIEERDYPFDISQFMQDIVRGIVIALRNTLWQTVYTISILILSFVPIIGWATPILALLTECYYYGFSMMDYSCERRSMTAWESVYYIGNHKGLATGNGLVFYLMHIFPVVGWVLAPAYAVIAATLSMIEVKEKKVVV